MLCRGRSLVTDYLSSAKSLHGYDRCSCPPTIHSRFTGRECTPSLVTVTPGLVINVAHRYLAYHLLQFAETIVGTVVSVLCNQALLVSVGVSAEGSIFGAVAVQWIIKDGVGEVVKLFFIRRFSPYFDRSVVGIFRACYTVNHGLR